MPTYVAEIEVSCLVHADSSARAYDIAYDEIVRRLADGAFIPQGMEVFEAGSVKAACRRMDGAIPESRPIGGGGRTLAELMEGKP